MANQTELDNAKATLERHGYEVAQHADQFGNNPYLIVQDPIYQSGTGPCSGKLVFMGYESKIVHGYNAARRFINARS